jgi:D-sedoheptulose 7-phosphate isomerase
MLEERIQKSIENLKTLLRSTEQINAIKLAAILISTAIISGNKLMICGNGGSAADAQHMAGEFVCKLIKNREPMAAVALSTDTSVLTSISNDYSYDDIFTRQVKALGKNGDVLIGISTSGKSKNVICALKMAKGLSVRTILLTSERANKMENLADIIINAPSKDTPRIQEMHLLIEHIISEMVEDRLR